MSKKESDFYGWLLETRESFDVFASDEEREAEQWIYQHMPSEALLWEELAMCHDE